MQWAKRAGLSILLIGTWLLLFFTLSVFTQLIMAPWDTSLVRPELGTWQRTLNDFFEGSGALIVSVPILLVSCVLTLRAVRARPQAAAQFVVGNILCIAALWVAFWLAAAINNQILYPYPPVAYDPNWEGYHRSVFPMLVLLAVCAGWLVWHQRVNKRLIHI